MLPHRAPPPFRPSEVANTTYVDDLHTQSPVQFCSGCGTTKRFHKDHLPAARLPTDPIRYRERFYRCRKNAGGCGERITVAEMRTLIESSQNAPAPAAGVLPAAPTPAPPVAQAPAAIPVVAGAVGGFGAANGYVGAGIVVPTHAQAPAAQTPASTIAQGQAAAVPTTGAPTHWINPEHTLINMSQPSQAPAAQTTASTIAQGQAADVPTTSAPTHWFNPENTLIIISQPSPAAPGVDTTQLAPIAPMAPTASVAPVASMGFTAPQPEDTQDVSVAPVTAFGNTQTESADVAAFESAVPADVPANDQARTADQQFPLPTTRYDPLPDEFERQVRELTYTKLMMRNDWPNATFDVWACLYHLSTLEVLGTWPDLDFVVEMRQTMRPRVYQPGSLPASLFTGTD